jgi:hypothetical protein
MEQIYFRFRTLLYKDGPWNLLFPFLKYIFENWERFGYFLLGSCNPNLVTVSYEFSGNIIQPVKSKNLFWKHFNLNSYF